MTIVPFYYGKSGIFIQISLKMLSNSLYSNFMIRSFTFKILSNSRLKGPATLKVIEAQQPGQFTHLITSGCVKGQHILSWASTLYAALIPCDLNAPGDPGASVMGGGLPPLSTRQPCQGLEMVRLLVPPNARLILIFKGRVIVGLGQVYIRVRVGLYP